MWNEEAHTLKVKRYAAHIIELDEYLDLFMSFDAEKNDSELNYIILHIITNGCSGRDFLRFFTLRSLF